jgi:hypothetical protein
MVGWKSVSVEGHRDFEQGFRQSFKVLDLVSANLLSLGAGVLRARASGFRALKSWSSNLPSFDALKSG